jgi:hypothetical protein
MMTSRTYEVRYEDGARVGGFRSLKDAEKYLQGNCDGEVMGWAQQTEAPGSGASAAEWDDYRDECGYSGCHH